MNQGCDAQKALVKLGDEYVGFHYTSIFLYMFEIPHTKVLAPVSRQVNIKFLIQTFQAMLVDEPHIENQHFTNIIVKVLNDLDLPEVSLMLQKSLLHLLILSGDNRLMLLNLVPKRKPLKLS